MSHPDTHCYTLHVLGAPDLRSRDGRRVTSILAQPKRLGLLTYLAIASGPVSRASVVALFWPDSDETRARNALSQALFHLRRSLGDDIVQSVEGDRLWIPRELLWCDARELLAGRTPGAVSPDAVERDLLEGWNAEDSHPLQEWLDSQRRTIRESGERAKAQDRREPAFVVPHVREPTWASPLRGPSHEPFRPARAARWFLSYAGKVVLVILASGFSWAALGVLGVIVIGVAVAVADTGSKEAPREQVAVLFPRVIAFSGVSEWNAQILLDEILAHLPTDGTFRIVPIPTASSPPELRRQLSAIGAADDDPDWVLETSLRITSHEVRVVSFLYRTPMYEVSGRDTYDAVYADGDAILVDVPREIASRISAMVARTLANGSARGR